MINNKNGVEPQKRAHSPLLAAGNTSEYKNSKLPYGRRFHAACGWELQSLLLQIGERLREARLARNESQELFAQRLGLTRQSYSKMEKGSPQTLIGKWLEASSILGRLDGWQEVLAPKEDLFAKLKRKTSKRQRAGGRRKKKT